MLIIQVDVQVLPEAVDAFVQTTRRNAEASLREPGIARFDVLQQRQDPTRFLLIEAYREDSAPAAHKLTPHYLLWRDTVAPMMARPRSSIQYVDIHYPV